MNKSELEKKQKAIEDRFGQLVQNAQKLNEQMQRIEMEKLRLQGEYRVISELVEKSKEQKEPEKKIPQKKAK